MRMTMRMAYVCAVIATSAALMIACGTHSGDDDDTLDDPNAMLVLSPPTSQLTITGSAGSSEPFTATLVHQDGTMDDVTQYTTFGTDDIYGLFSGPMLTVTSSGKINVVAQYSQKTGTAEVIATVNEQRVDPAVPPNAPELFAGATEDATIAPTVVYPPPDVIVPRNLGDFETHWKDTSSNDIYQITLHSQYADVTAYVPATTPSMNPATTPTTGWMDFLAAEWIAASGTETVLTLTVRGMNSANPASVGTAPVQTVNLSNEDMLGGLYYWSTASTDNIYGIFRHDMSKPETLAEQYETSVQAPGGHACVACHVLSRDGTEMAVTFDGGGGPATLLDVASSTLQPIANHWDFGTFTADGTEFLAEEGGTIVVRKYADQSVVTTLATGGLAAQPDMSPDGTMLTWVQTVAGDFGADYSLTGGQIMMATFDETTNTLGAPIPVVADSFNNYYPTFSPDGQWILYTRATGNASYNNAGAEVAVVKAAMGATPLALDTLNTATASLTNSWARWAPYAQTYGANSTPITWITVSSKRDFGVRLVGIARPQLWMTPFFADRASAGMDPSSPPFRLPFQNIESSNHIAQWTEQIVMTGRTLPAHTPATPATPAPSTAASYTHP